MIAIVPKWKITVTLPTREVVIYISEQHLGNVLRTVASMDFTDSAIEQPTQITIALRA